MSMFVLVFEDGVKKGALLLVFYFRETEYHENCKGTV